MEERAPATREDRYLVAASIVIAGAIIAAAIIWNGNKQPVERPTSGIVGSAIPSPGGTPKGLRPVSVNEHIRGNANAAVKIIEFSDLECPFCKRFHYTMKQIMEIYGNDVAWVYRHLPLAQLHSKATQEAEATECAAGLGGNDAFWRYTDRLFELTPSNNGLDLALLPQIAVDIGLDRAQFESCLAKKQYASRITDDIADAQNNDISSTPFSFVVGSTGEVIAVIPGALPFENVKSIVEQALKTR